MPGSLGDWGIDMSLTFSGEIVAKLGWNWADSGGVVDNGSLRYRGSLGDGNDPNEAEAVWHKESVSLLSAAADTYDLTALAESVFGDTLYVNFLTIKAIQVVNLSTAATAGQLLVGGAASNEWKEAFGAAGDIVRVPIDSALLLSSRRCGWEVDDSNKNLKILASGGDVTYSIAILGTITVAMGDCSSSGL